VTLNSKERQWLEQLVLHELKAGHKVKDVVERSDEGYSNELFEVSTDWGGVFLKLNRELNLFDGEVASLTALASACGESLRVPGVKAHGVLPALFNGAPGSWLALEHVYMRDIASHPKDQALLGAAVARLHSAPAPHARFGFAVPTYLGGMRLDNEWHDDWWTFFAERRLAPLFRAAGVRYRDRALSSLWRRLAVAIPRLFAGPAAPKIVPSLLHGDLTPLNASSTELKLGKWQPCLFDPAAQYGDAEFDLALSMLPIMEQYHFHPLFYDAYFAVRPKAAGFDERNKIYVLYHALNHHNVYGAAYGDFKAHVLRLGEELLATIDPIADAGPQAGDAELDWDRIEEELARKERAAEARHVPEFKEAFKTVEEEAPTTKSGGGGGRRKYDDSDSSEEKPETALPKFTAPVLPVKPLSLNQSANVDSDSESSSDDEKRKAPELPAEGNAFASIFAAVDDDKSSESEEAAPAAAAPESHKSPRGAKDSKSSKKSSTKAKSIETKTSRKEMKTEIDVDAELVSPRRKHHKLKSSGSSAVPSDALSPRSKSKESHGHHRK
jgi:protein-ribulosamine 3-kinase